MDLITFLLKYSSYYCTYHYRPAADSERFRALLENGVQTFPGYFSSQKIDAIVRGVENLGFQYQPRDNGFDNAKFEWRNYRIVDQVEEMGEVVADSLIADGSSYYLSGRGFLSRCMLAQKNLFNQKKDGPTSEYHFDDWKHRLKVMIYLDDVNEDNGPFSFLQGSHRFCWWKLIEDYKFYRDFDRAQPPTGGNTNWAAVYSGANLEKLKERFSWKSFRVLAPKGTVTLFDSRGLHRGEPLVRGFRRVLILHFKTELNDGEKLRWRERAQVDIAGI